MVTDADLPQVKIARQLANQYRFFHWALEFPEVFMKGGFDCVLGNPPWERIKIEEQEFFSTRDIEIATAKNKAGEKLINALQLKKPSLAKEFFIAKHFAESYSNFMRYSGRYPLTAIGDINTLSLIYRFMSIFKM